MRNRVFLAKTAQTGTIYRFWRQLTLSVLRVRNGPHPESAEYLVDRFPCTASGRLSRHRSLGAKQSRHRPAAYRCSDKSDLRKRTTAFVRQCPDEIPRDARPYL